ncbi:CPBP family intramembrane glutamic endopeptidase [uncultured Formosa sp.]|uniref:CPBP family intramembrane glutamic endopeptidase n=1 Tax=uncultured Formosa sp. TaxID=255435 RepID=UPI002602B2DF|nr:CPBP family intramembrane glutamic endopeptidase [uncultured Formosa sp.]
MELTRKKIVIVSPFFIIGINFGIAHLFGNIIGKWVFIPIILIEWCLFLFFILRFTEIEERKKWLLKAKGPIGWTILAVCIGLLPLPLFLTHYNTLSVWSVWLPWILIALINPWLEEFYWRGLLLDYTRSWNKWTGIIYTSLFFALNHAIFGIHSELNSGITIIIATFVMGLIWGLVYKKTDSLKWIIFAHFLVDILNLSAASFLDLYEKGNW